jgi:hypothetical protein
MGIDRMTIEVGETIKIDPPLPIDGIPELDKVDARF